MAVSLDLIKKLREEMGVGINHCKQALEESNGDYAQAVDWLRKKGMATAAKKSGRTAAEGLVAACISSDLKSGYAIEVNSETDFVAGNDKFQSLVSKIASLAQSANNLDELLNMDSGSGESVAGLVVSATAMTGEKISLRRFAKLEVSSGVVESYIHNAASGNPTMGRIGVLLAIECNKDIEQTLGKFAKKICMHIAAFSPVALSIDSVSPETLEREREIFRHQAKESGKPDDVVEKMVEGRIRKFYSESVLLEQAYVMDNKISISQAVDQFSKESSCTCKIKDFVLFRVGEGIEEAAE